MSKTPRFIVVSLCDNDFAGELQEAVTRVFSELGTDQTEVVFRRCVIDLTVALNTLRNAAFARDPFPTRLREYLEGKLRVEFNSVGPDNDHDGGSVAIDTNRNYIWRY
jgi:hypothetical protein